MTEVRSRLVPVAVAAILGLGIAGWCAVPWDAGGGPGGTLTAVVPAVRAASPPASAGIGGDTRSAGEGPGFVGAPLLAILGVLGLGVATALATLLYVRLTGRPPDAPRPTGSSSRDGPDSNGR